MNLGQRAAGGTPHSPTHGRPWDSMLHVARHTVPLTGGPGDSVLQAAHGPTHGRPWGQHAASSTPHGPTHGRPQEPSARCKGGWRASGWGQRSTGMGCQGPRATWQRLQSESGVLSAARLWTPWCPHLQIRPTTGPTCLETIRRDHRDSFSWFSTTPGLSAGPVPQAHSLRETEEYEA